MKLPLASLILLFSGCENDRPPFALPRAPEITVMFAEVYEDETLKRFEVPETFYEPILESLNDAKKDRFPSEWAELGSIEIAMRSGLLEVELFRTGEPIGAFRANENYYRGGLDAEFVRVITEASKGGSEHVVGGNGG